MTSITRGSRIAVLWISKWDETPSDGKDRVLGFGKLKLVKSRVVGRVVWRGFILMGPP